MVEVGPQICQQFALFVRCYGLTLSWNTKDYWGLNEVHASAFLVRGKTLVIITVLTWCYPRIHEILLHDTSVQRNLTSDWGWAACSPIEDTAHELWHVCAPFYRSISVFFIAELNKGWHKKTGTFEKPNKNWRNPKKKKLLIETEPLQLAFQETVIQIISVWKLRPVDGVLLHVFILSLPLRISNFPFFCVTLCVACSAECDRVTFGLLSLKMQVVTVQFISIIFFFLDFFNFCWVILKFPFFCVTLYNSIIFLFVFVHELRIKQSKILWRVIKKYIVH